MIENDKGLLIGECFYNQRVNTGMTTIADTANLLGISFVNPEAASEIVDLGKVNWASYSEVTFGVAELSHLGEYTRMALGYAYGKRLPLLPLTSLIYPELESMMNGNRPEFLEELFLYQNNQSIGPRLRTFIQNLPSVSEYSADLVAFGQSLVLNRQNLTVRRSSEIIKLTKREFELLDALVTQTGRRVSNEDLLTSIWGEFADRSVLGVNIGRLRKKIEIDPSNPEVILNIHGGYKVG